MKLIFGLIFVLLGMFAKWWIPFLGENLVVLLSSLVLGSTGGYLIARWGIERKLRYES